MRMLELMRGKTRADRTRNENMHEMLGVAPIEVLLHKTWFVSCDYCDACLCHH